MNQLVIMLLIDGFRADYIRYTSYLKEKQSCGVTGRLRECFGFVPRAAYFAGLTAEQFGFTNMFIYDPQNSPFSAARFFPAVKSYPKVERLTGIRQEIEQVAKTKTTPYAAKYLYSVDIPIHFLSMFDLAEKQAIWDARYPDLTFFHILNERNIPWYICAWPDTNLLDDHKDQAILEKTLEEISLDHRFAFIHFQELDGMGHAYGPSSREIIEAVQSTDRLIQRLVETLENRFDQVSLLIFGDHGMVNIHHHLDVWEKINQTNLRVGNDFAFFLDSTMARFWFKTKSAQQEIHEALSELKGGHVLKKSELEDFGIAHCDPRNGELYFLADPGVLIYPNFFQTAEPPVKGMHGYDPNFVDNLGYFLVISPQVKNTGRVTFGNVDPPQLFNTLLDLMDLPQQTMAHPSVLNQIQEADPAPYTCCKHPDANRVVEKQLQVISQLVQQELGEPEAIVLTGSFGRGEGGMIVDNEKPLPLNDYDLIVVSQENKQDDLNKLGDRLAHQLGTDYVDLAWSDGNWGQLPLTMLNYDLKYGSQVILGRADVLDGLPHYPADEIPVIEAVMLLLNRTAGLLTGLRGEFFEGKPLSAREKRYLLNQAVKASIATGDSFLIHWKSYDTSYRTRRERFNVFGKAQGLPEDLLQRVTKAYDLKIQPFDADGFELRDLRGVWDDLKISLLQSCAELSFQTISTLDEAMNVFIDEFHHQNPYYGDNARCLQHELLSAVVKPSLAQKISFRAVLYSSLPFLLAAVLDEENRPQHLLTALSRVREGFYLPATNTWSYTVWEDIRSKIIQWWFAFIH